MGKFEGLMKHPEHGDGSNGGFPISPLQPIRFGMLFVYNGSRLYAAERSGVAI